MKQVKTVNYQVVYKIIGTNKFDIPLGTRYRQTNDPEFYYKPGHHKGQSDILSISHIKEGIEKGWIQVLFE